MKERTLATGGLQVAIAVFGLVPVGAGLAGVIQGAGMTGGFGAPGLGHPSPGHPSLAEIGLDSHVRYLSGLLLAIGLIFWATIPTIETSGPRVRLLTAIVFTGGLARLAGAVAHEMPPAPMVFGLVMELLVTPGLCLWQAWISAPIAGRTSRSPRAGSASGN